MLARPRAASPASCSFSSDLLAGREKEKTEKHCVGDAKMVGELAGLCAARPASKIVSSSLVSSKRVLVEEIPFIGVAVTEYFCACVF